MIERRVVLIEGEVVPGAELKVKHGKKRTIIALKGYSFPVPSDGLLFYYQQDDTILTFIVREYKPGIWRTEKTEDHFKLLRIHTRRLKEDETRVLFLKKEFVDHLLEKEMFPSHFTITKEEWKLIKTLMSI